MARPFVAWRTLLTTGAAAVALAAGGCAEQTGPASADLPPPTDAAKPAVAEEAPRRGISLRPQRHAEGSTHFQRPGPRTELISDDRAVDVSAGERAVSAPVAGGSWRLVSAGPYSDNSAPVQDAGVVVVSVAREKAGGDAMLTIDNRLDRILYVPPIVIYADGPRAGALAGKGCNLPSGAGASFGLPEHTLSFVLANVEKPMDAPVCGADHELFPGLQD